jgi:hypothetical protein
MDVKTLGVHSNLFAPPTKHIDIIHLKNANNTQYLTKFDYFAPLFNIFCMHTKYLSQ